MVLSYTCSYEPNIGVLVGVENIEGIEARLKNTKRRIWIASCSNQQKDSVPKLEALGFKALGWSGNPVHRLHSQVNLLVRVDDSKPLSDIDLGTEIPVTGHHYTNDYFQMAGGCGDCVISPNYYARAEYGRDAKSVLHMTDLGRAHVLTFTEASDEDVPKHWTHITDLLNGRSLVHWITHPTDKVF